MKTIVLTGATGFIGSHFFEKYQEKYKIICISLRNIDVDQINFENVDAVVHMAGIAHSKGVDPKDYLKTNTELTIKIAEKAKQSGVRHFVFLSTIKVFGNDGLIVNQPQILTENTPINPVDPYGTSKALAEKGLLSIEGPGFNVAFIRPSMVYGPRVRGNMRLLLKLVQQSFILPFDYDMNQRSVVSVANLLHLLDRVIQSDARGIYLAYDGRGLSIKEIIENICKGLNRKVINFQIPVFVFKGLCLLNKGIMNRLFGSLVVKQLSGFSEIGYSPVQTSEEGIVEMCNWYLNQ